MDDLEKALRSTLYKKSFYEFVRYFWDCADPQPFVDGKLVKFYCEMFQYMCRLWIPYEEKTIKIPKITDNVDVINIINNKKRLCLNVPPRHSKSMIFNVLGPTWLWTSHPILAVSVSHTQKLSKKMNDKRNKIINSLKFRELFPEIKLAINTVELLKDNRGGELYSISRNALLGNGADLIINDDLTNAESARKDMAEMNNCWAYYRNTMPSRINDPERAIIMNIQQRLAPNDITGHILSDPKLSELYNFVVLPAVFKKDTYCVCPISGDVIEWKKGETLWPERFGNYNELRNEVGDTVFETEYLQNPIATDKTIIKEEYFVEKSLNEVPSLDNADMIYASHDFPIKDKEQSDFLGSILAYRFKKTLYIYDCLEKKMAFPKSISYVQQIDDIYPSAIQIIEDKANGAPILQQLQDVVPGLQAYDPETNSKSQRLESASLYMKSGNVVFVKTKFNENTKKYELSESLQNLKTRLLNFPFVSHDDIVDAFSMMLLYVFMDRRYMVYGRAFDDSNLIPFNEIKNYDDLYSNIFFNKEGDLWKACEIAIYYGTNTNKLIIKNETRFKASIEDGIEKLKEFSKDKKVIIDCSATDALNGIFTKNCSIERYIPVDFDKSVAQLNLALSKKQVLLYQNCNMVISDIESFKFSKSKDDNVKFITKKDGFIACIRQALYFYGGIV